MLVLSRKSGERITIGQDIVITVLRSQGGTVRLGIEAPKQVKVLRAELPLDEPKRTVAAVVNGALAADGIRTEETAGSPHSSRRTAPAANNPQKWSILSMRQRIGAAGREPNPTRSSLSGSIDGTVR